MRKLALAIATMLFMAGLVVAAEVTLVKYDKDKKEITVKDGDKEKTYKLSDKTKFTMTTKDGDTEGSFEKTEKMLTNEKFPFGKAKWDITTEGDNVTAVKMKGFGGKKKQDKNQ